MSNKAEQYFDRFSGSWSDHYAKGGLMAGRVEQFRRALAGAGLPAGARILDFGCGTGEITCALAQDGFAVDGVDISEGMLSQARNRNLRAPVRWQVVETGSPLPFADQSFAAIISSSVLEYVAAPAPLLVNFASLLAPGGRLVFTVPDIRHSTRRREAWWARLSRSDLAYALLRQTRWEPIHTYLRISCSRFDEGGWGSLLSAAGLVPRPWGDCVAPLIMLNAEKPM